ncbi:MAG: response regulator receiver modulated diguanylate cyclase [Paucimonas sp.]|nr:response regulator receiver modulated diguanylate cyclase [Paucimonas sp.]
MIGNVGGEASVLIVDDLPENIGVLRGMLAPEGYQLYAAMTGEHAIKIARQYSPDLILLDVSMPGMNGFETCYALRQDSATASIPVVFVTAHSATADVVAGFRAGAVDYIGKPLRREEVCARVRTHIQNSRLLKWQRSQTEEFRAIVNNMSEGLLMFTPEGVVRFVNPAALHLIGQVEEDVTGRSITNLLPPTFAQSLIRYMLDETAGSGEAQRAFFSQKEIEIRRPDGNIFPVDFSLSRIFLREPLFVGVMHDMSTHKASQDELRRMIRNDPLTGISNRRHLDDFVSQEWQRAQRSGKAIGLAMIDVDHFKQYNDELGHLAGDRCLQRIAVEIRKFARRSTDLAARYGGEEFAMVFAEFDTAHSFRVADSLRRAVSSLALPHPASPTSSVVTVSVGMATLVPSAQLSVHDLFAKADAALYEAKRSGRNKTIVVN